LIKKSIVALLVLLLVALVPADLWAGEAINTADTLRAAIEDMIETFGERYPDGQKFLAELEEVGGKDLAILRRRALTANPLISDNPILFVTRQQYIKDHHNTATIFQTCEINTEKFTPGGALKTIDFSRGRGKVKTLFDPGSKGMVRDPEVHFNGDRVIFSMRKSIDEDYHICEINADGSDFRQLTSAPGVSDIDPLYMPDDTIVFSATREPKYCMCNRHIMCNLYRMESDGANIRQIGKNTLFEGHGSLLADGKILYDRWEYVDRNFGDAQGLWMCNPDGAAHVVYYGNNTASPGGVIDARQIPGSQSIMAVLSSCHDRPWGALGIIDRSKGVDGREPVLRTWPAEAIDIISLEGTKKWDKFKPVRPRYEDPFPLSEKYFLCARTIAEKGDDEKTGIFLLDIFGNELLLYEDEKLGCYDPMPLAQSKRPPVIPSVRDFAEKSGKFYVQDVYIGTHMEGVKRGEVKWLRVIESPEKRNWTTPSWQGQGAQAPAMNWHGFENKRILGTVPVEADGSVYFEVPAEKFVYFQLLDKDGMLVQSMRSGTMVQAGETAACIGCHEDRVGPAPVVTTQPEALKRMAESLDGWQGQARLFNYLDEVQPVFDKHCVSCHDFGEEAGEVLNLAGDKTLFFNVSYSELWKKDYIACVGGGPSQIQQARSWGPAASMLTDYLRGHEGVELSDEEYDRIITWMNLNAPYYPVYECAFPDNPAGRAPITNDEFKKFCKLIWGDVVKKAAHNSWPGVMISFDRPQLSPCLELAKDEKSKNELLQIIGAGAERLKKTPRADMAGFVPCDKDLERNRKYEKRMEIEAKIRLAIEQGRKIYDHTQ
jgi:hypothetical protein